MSNIHLPVMAKEVIEYLNPKEGQVFIDATLGAGGHARLILEKIGKHGKLYAFDLDQRNIEIAQKNLCNWDNLEIIKANFSAMGEIFENKHKSKKVDGVLFDLGISSMHLDIAGRGFSFKQEGPLDMRLSDQNDLSAYKIINQYKQYDLAQIFFKYGEEPQAKKIAASIVKNREQKTINTTTELTEIIEKASSRKHHKKDKTATRVFQALRITVNKELYHLEKGLEQALQIVKKYGRVAVISFHSLEDRIVKQKFKEVSKKCKCPQEAMICICENKAEYKILTRKPITASQEELESNPRARSAKLRVIEKVI